MRFLPIVERELRVAARRKSTFRVRFWAAAAATGVALLALLGFSFFALLSQRTDGGPVFSLLSHYALLLCLLAGLHFTADSLSAEKREGTLGLLFLTDLQGYDVVLGKFAANSLNAVYGLVAILPIIGLPLLMGGLTGLEFWRTALVLVNTLFLSLAFCLGVSAFAREASRALALSAVGLVAISVLPPLVELLRGWLPFPWPMNLAGLSPWSALQSAREPFAAAAFWTGLAMAHAAGWFCLALASWRLPRAWLQRESAPAAPGRRWGWSLGVRRVPTRSPAGQRLLTNEPLRWIHGQSRPVSAVAWLLAAGYCAAVVCGMNWIDALDPSVGLQAVAVFGGWAAGFVIKLMLAVRACGFFVEARQTGALELLLSSPLSAREILQGPVRALRREFGGPILLLAASLIAVPLASLLFNLSHKQDLGETLLMGYYGLSGAVGLVMDAWAMVWMGTWLALTMKKPSLAPGLNFVLVVLGPMLVPCVSSIFTSLGYLVFARSRLLYDLRGVALQHYHSPFASMPERLATPPGTPPVLAG